MVATLLLRAAVSGAFAAWLLTATPAWGDVFHFGAFYAFADGLLGLLMAARLESHEPVPAPPVLVAFTIVDAVFRCAIGALVLLFPGIPDVPLATVLFFGILGAWALSAGTIAIVAWLLAHRAQRAARRDPHTETHDMFDPLTEGGLIAAFLAVYALTAGPPTTAYDLRFAGAVAGLAFASVLAIAAFGVATHSRVSRR